MIANAEPTSMESVGYHIVAGARCVEIRGPNQFRNAVSNILFIQLRRLIVRSILIHDWLMEHLSATDLNLSPTTGAIALCSQDVVSMGGAHADER